MQNEIKLNSLIDKISYAIGFDIGKNLRGNQIDVAREALITGITEGLEKDIASLLTEQEMVAALQELQKDLTAKQQEAGQKMYDVNVKAGQEFLQNNAKNAGVVQLPSGLQYTVLKSGTGKTPAATSTVTTHYTGRLIDGTEFDSSYRRNEPATFPVNGVIRGWTEALQLMKEGDVWILYIPAHLAYGEQGAGGVIPPGATLVFEIELIAVA
ncbi:MAG: FKBP-type peptidyl-prolyl cis-trans isomerase [Ignavibacteria bacterium]|nr:FKBP-type peptidyl-prolyl cis-trans isomerase [Ignavibacteria bacterium]